MDADNGTAGASAFICVHLRLKKEEKQTWINADSHGSGKGESVPIRENPWQNKRTFEDSSRAGVVYCKALLSTLCACLEVLPNWRVALPPSLSRDFLTDSRLFLDTGTDGGS
jgi:hypothetical protein